MLKQLFLKIFKIFSFSFEILINFFYRTWLLFKLFFSKIYKGVKSLSIRVYLYKIFHLIVFISYFFIEKIFLFFLFFYKYINYYLFYYFNYFVLRLKSLKLIIIKLDLFNFSKFFKVKKNNFFFYFFFEKLNKLISYDNYIYKTIINFLLFFIEFYYFLYNLVSFFFKVFKLLLLIFFKKLILYLGYVAFFFFKSFYFFLFFIKSLFFSFYKLYDFFKTLIQKFWYSFMLWTKLNVPFFYNLFIYSRLGYVISIVYLYAVLILPFLQNFELSYLNDQLSSISDNFSWHGSVFYFNNDSYAPGFKYFFDPADFFLIKVYGSILFFLIALPSVRAVWFSEENWDESNDMDDDDVGEDDEEYSTIIEAEEDDEDSSLFMDYSEDSRGEDIPEYFDELRERSYVKARINNFTYSAGHVLNFDGWGSFISTWILGFYVIIKLYFWPSFIESIELPFFPYLSFNHERERLSEPTVVYESYSNGNMRVFTDWVPGSPVSGIWQPNWPTNPYILKDPKMLNFLAMPRDYSFKTVNRRLLYLRNTKYSQAIFILPPWYTEREKFYSKLAFLDKERMSSALGLLRMLPIGIVNDLILARDKSLNITGSAGFYSVNKFFTKRSLFKPTLTNIFYEIYGVFPFCFRDNTLFDRSVWNVRSDLNYYHNWAINFVHYWSADSHYSDFNFSLKNNFDVSNLNRELRLSSDLYDYFLNSYFSYNHWLNFFDFRNFYIKIVFNRNVLSFPLTYKTSFPFVFYPKYLGTVDINPVPFHSNFGNFPHYAMASFRLPTSWYPLFLNFTINNRIHPHYWNYNPFYSFDFGLDSYLLDQSIPYWVFLDKNNLYFNHIYTSLFSDLLSYLAKDYNYNKYNRSIFLKLWYEYSEGFISSLFVGKEPGFSIHSSLVYTKDYEFLYNSLKSGALGNEILNGPFFKANSSLIEKALIFDKLGISVYKEARIKYKRWLRLLLSVYPHPRSFDQLKEYYNSLVFFEFFIKNSNINIIELNELKKLALHFKVLDPTFFDYYSKLFESFFKKNDYYFYQYNFNNFLFNKDSSIFNKNANFLGVVFNRPLPHFSLEFRRATNSMQESLERRLYNPEFLIGYLQDKREGVPNNSDERPPIWVMLKRHLFYGYSFPPYNMAELKTSRAGFKPLKIFTFMDNFYGLKPFFPSSTLGGTGEESYNKGYMAYSPLSEFYYFYENFFYKNRYLFNMYNDTGINFFLNVNLSNFGLRALPYFYVSDFRLDRIDLDKLSSFFKSSLARQDYSYIHLLFIKYLNFDYYNTFSNNISLIYYKSGLFNYWYKDLLLFTFTRFEFFNELPYQFYMDSEGLLFNKNKLFIFDNFTLYQEPYNNLYYLSYFYYNYIIPFFFNIYDKALSIVRFFYDEKYQFSLNKYLFLYNFSNFYKDWFSFKNLDSFLFGYFYLYDDSYYDHNFFYYRGSSLHPITSNYISDLHLFEGLNSKNFVPYSFYDLSSIYVKDISNFLKKDFLVLYINSVKKGIYFNVFDIYNSIFFFDFDKVFKFFFFNINSLNHQGVVVLNSFLFNSLTSKYYFSFYFYFLNNFFGDEIILSYYKNNYLNYFDSFFWVDNSYILYLMSYNIDSLKSLLFNYNFLFSKYSFLLKK